MFLFLRCVTSLIIIGLLLLFQQASAVLTTTIVSDSIHGISMPITFTCIVEEYDHQIDSVLYQWFQWCSETNEYTLLPDERGYELNVSYSKTASLCWDGVLCNVTDTEGDIGSAFVTLPNGTGVGLTINGNTVLNSSMILTKSLTSFNQLYCLSSAHGSAVLKPYWILPNGVIVNQSTSEFNVQASNGTSSYLFMSLSVNNGSEYTQGHYQCVIPDEYQNTQLLQVWIFREGFYDTPKILTHYSYFDSEFFQFLCVFQGTPGTIQWYRDDVPLAFSHMNYTITQELTNKTSFVYVSTMVISDRPPLEILGDYKCEFTANIVREQNEWLAESTVLSLYFILQPIGKHHVVQCPVPSAEDVIVWVTTGDGDILTQPHLNNGTGIDVEFNPIKDIDHEKVFICHSDTMVPLMFTIISIKPSSQILSVSFPISEIIPISGQSISLQCTSMKLNLGFTQSPGILWILPSNKIASLDTNRTTVKDSNSTSTLSINHLQTSDAGVYSCIAVLSSRILEDHIVASVDQVLVIKMADPTVVLAVNTTSDNSPQLVVYRGSISLFTCTAIVSPTIDTNITVQTTWYIGDNFEVVTNETDSFIIVTDSVNVDKSVYESQLLMPLVQSATIIEKIGCRVILLPSYEDYFLYRSEATVVKEIVLLEPEISASVLPTKLSVLDFSPYDSFTLTCIVEGLEYIAVQPIVIWSLDGMDLDTNGYLINTTIVQLGSIHSVLTAVGGNLPGMYKYSCHARLILPNDSSTEFSDFADITVKEPSHPYPPTDIAVLALGSQKAIISWLVPVVSYGPEHYVIQYGLFEDDLVNTSSTLYGNKDINLPSQIYNLTLSNLLHNTTYYYRILTANNYTKTTSMVINTFRTPEISFSIEVLQVLLVVAGSEQNLSCLTRSNISETIPVITWLSPDGQEIKNNSSKWTVLPPEHKDDVTQVTIHLPVVSTSDAGMYTCRASVTSNEENLEVQQYLIVKIPMPTVHITISPMSEHGIYVGHDISISCEVLNLNSTVDTNITVATRWTRNNHDFVPTASSEEYLKSSITIKAVNDTNTGVYECEMTISHNDAQNRGSLGEEIIVPVTVKRGIDIDVQGLPPHNMSTVAQGSMIVGSSGNKLTCSMVSLDPLIDTLTLTWYSSDGKLLRNISISDLVHNDIFSLNLEFQTLKASNGGKYYCHARSDLKALGLMQTTKMEQDLVVSLPPLQLNISLTPPSTVDYYAGSALDLICSAKLIPEVDVNVRITPLWQKDNGVQLPNTTRISNIVPDYSSVHHHTDIVRFHTLSRAFDEGEYHCQVLIATVPLSQFIYPFQSEDITVDVHILEPSIIISIYPSITTILNIEPYNQLHLSCQVDTEKEVKSQKKISWRMLRVGSESLSTAIHDNTTDLTIIEEELQDGLLSSNLFGLLHIPGEYHFMCDGLIDITEDNGPFGTKTTIVIVKGPSEPHPCTNVSARRGVTVDSVLINWSVDEITYTPEQYTVHYGLSRESLNTKAAPVMSGTDLALKNANYQVSIDGLELGKQYYYRIVSDNLYHTNRSEMKYFMAGFNRSLFLVQLNGVHRCGEWIFIDAKAKIEDITVAISSVIKSRCSNCSFTQDHITGGQFTCEDTISDVLFYAYIYQTVDTEPRDLLSHLNKWSSTSNGGSPSVVVNGAKLLIAQICEVNSTDETICSTALNPDDGSTIWGFPSYLIFVIAGGGVGVVIAVCCICMVIFILCKFHRKAKESTEENVRMKELIRASSLPALSPLHLDHIDGHYTSPKPLPRYPQTPPPNYMSPRSSVLGKPAGKPSSQRLRRPTKERDSHIYYLNTPPRTTSHLPQEEDPVYEVLPEDDGNYQTPRKFFPPDVPPRPLSRRRSESLADKLSTGLSLSRNCLDESEKQDPIELDEDGCDYVEMNSVDFSPATL